MPAVLLLGGSAFLMSRNRHAAGADAAPIVLTRRQEMLLFGAVIGLAAFFRLWRFYEFPQGVWFDEGINATDAIFIIDNEHFMLWRDTVQGRPTLYLYLLAGSFQMFGTTMFALRIVPVVAGLAAVVAFYFLARSLIGVVPGLVATALFAVSRWATTFSRISWEASLVPVLEIASVYFLLRALETRRRWFFVLAGSTLALGLYTYVAFRIVPVVLLMFLGYIALTQWRLLWRNVPGIVLYAVAFFAVVAPLANYALNNQDKVLERTRNVNVFQEVDDRDSYEPLRFNLEANVRMMNVEGDRNGRHNIPYEPLLDEITAALLVLGLAVSVWSIRDWRKGGIAFWYVLALVPGALTITIENPSAIRAVGALPPLYLLAGMAVATTYRAVAPMRNGAMIFGAIAVGLVGASTAINYYDLFERQAKAQSVYDGFEPYYRHVGEAVAEQAGEKSTYVSRAFDGHPAVKMLGHGNVVEPYTSTRNVVFPNNGRDVLLVMDITQFNMMPSLQRMYPGATKKDHVDEYGRVYFSEVTIPAADIEASHLLAVDAEGVDVDRAFIDRAWTEDDLAGGPIEVTYEGFFWVDSFPGKTDVELNAPGGVTVEVDGQRHEVASGAGTVGLGELTYGEHDITITARIEQPGRMAMRFNRDGRTFAGGDELYAMSFGERGFRVLHRADGQFSSAPVQIGHMPFGVAAEPMSPAASVELQGMLDVPADGGYGFALEGQNSVQLFIDNQLVVDNGGAHATRRVESEIRLEAGEHLVSIRYTAFDYPGWALFWREPLIAEWTPMDGSEFTVPTGEYVPPAVVTLVEDASWGGARALENVELPMGVALLPSGEVVVASRGRLTFMGGAGETLRQVDMSAGDLVDIVATANGYLVALERATNSLIVFDSAGAEVRRIAGAIASSGGLGVRGDRVYATSPAGGVVYAIDIPDGQVEAIAITNGGLVDKAVQPSDVAASDDGLLFLVDFEKRSVVVGTESRTTHSFGAAGGVGDQVPRVAVYGEFVFVAEAVAERIIIFDREGKQRGVYAFPAEVRGTRPTGMVVSPDGALYVVDIQHNRLYRFEIDVPAADAAPEPNEAPAATPLAE